MLSLGFVIDLLAQLIDMLDSVTPFGQNISILDLFISFLIVSTLIVVFIPHIKNDVKYK